MLKGFTRKFKPLEILTKEQVETIHRGILDVLQETGVRFESKRALKLFEKNDCQVDWSNNQVRFPPALVEECLRKAPSSFRIKARNPKNDLIIGGDTVYFEPGVGMQTIDIDTWELRTATRKENYDGVTILDALDTVHFLSCYCPYFGFDNVPSVMAMLESVAAKIRNSTKAQWSGYQGREMFTIEMAKVAEIELLGNIICSPPLTYYGDGVENIFRFIEAGFPIDVCGGGTIAGATGPATVAGSLIADGALNVAGIVLVQFIKPGTRVIVQGGAGPQNMRQGSPAFGAIGGSLHNVAYNQIFRHYKIPIMDAGCYAGSSKRIDYQNGYEKAIPAVLAALSGANLIGFHGGMYGELSWHPFQAIIDDDVAGMIGRFIEGIKVNDETLAIDLIEKVGPIPGFYLNKEHTRKWWKKEQFVPKVADRLTYPEWIKTGKKSCLDYAKERMNEIVATHKVAISLTSSQEKDIERILKEARKYYKEKGLI